MARLTNEARRQINTLGRHFRRKGRVEAIVRLRAAVEQALRETDAAVGQGHDFPSVYRELSEAGRYWIKIHRYWFAYEMSAGEAIITYVFYDQADIPGRLVL